MIGNAMSGDDVEQVVEYTFNHRKDSIAEFLSQYSIPTDGKKGQLRESVLEALKDGRIPFDDLVTFLDSLEGWGSQHIYLYEASPKIAKTWKTEASVKALLKEHGLNDLLNRRRPIVLPDVPTLSTIEWSTKRVRFVWIEKREWHERLANEDIVAESGDLIYRAYGKYKARGITAFDWNLISGEACLLIQSLPSGENYDAIRVQYEEELGGILDFEEFTRRRVTSAIKKLESSKETLNRKIELATRTGAIASYTSKGRKSDAYEDEDLKRSRNALGERTVSKSGNFYFQPTKGGLDRVLHVKIYTGDQRVGIFGECKEAEVQYVLSRIRQYCR